MDIVFLSAPTLGSRAHGERLAFSNQRGKILEPRVTIVRALMFNPKLLLLDEPLEGLAPIIVLDRFPGVARH